MLHGKLKVYLSPGESEKRDDLAIGSPSSLRLFRSLRSHDFLERLLFVPTL